MISKEEYKKRIDNFGLFISNYDVMSDFFLKQFEKAAEMYCYSDNRFRRKHNKHLRKLFFKKYKEIFTKDIKLEKSRKHK